MDLWLTPTFDTHKLVKSLTESGFEEPQAEALSEAIKTVQEVSLDRLATKEDVKEVKYECAKRSLVFLVG